VAEIAISQAAFAGFGILRRRPWAPLVWSLLYVGVLATLVTILGGAFIQAVGKLMTLQAGGKPPPVDLILGLLGSILGGYLLMIAVFWALGAVINMAVVRAVMAPEDGAFAYLRFGRAELWLMLANFVLFILYSIVSTAMAIPMALISAFVVTTNPDAAPFVTLPIQLVTWAITIWLGLRFCLVAPMIYADRKFRLFESWTLTRGHVGRLFQIGLVMVGVTVLVYIVLAAIGIGVAFPMFTQLASSTTPQAFFSRSPAEVWQAVSPFLVIYVVLIWIGSTVLFPLFFAPWPDAYRQLQGSELAATFS
jgi:hypothetical protein